MADHLADEGGEKRAGDAEHDGQDESARIVRARRQDAGKNSGNGTYDQNP